MNKKMSSLKKIVVYYRDRIIASFYPKYLADKTYKCVFRKKINWENPSNLIEKIYWLQFNSDTSLWTLCADKYRVRKFVEERNCGEILNELYGVWNKADEINFDLLPNSFVLKTNNSCGQIIIVKDKSRLNISEVRHKLNSWLKITQGLSCTILAYNHV